jgi:D-glycero-D-manno-heptose 1,7-bisphosphate phosphatase
MTGGRAVFLDRDGVLAIPDFREGRSFAVRRVEDFRLYPDAAQSVARLKAAGFKTIVVTNQPDVGNRQVERPVVEEMHRIMAATLPVDAIEVCYHTRTDGCDCRKPKPGMLERAAQRLGIDCRRSFIVGDRGSDVEAGQAVGCRTILIDLGYTSVDLGSPDHKVASLGAAVDIILAAS